MPALTKSEIEEFLSTGTNVLKLATIAPDGYPYVVPLWFWYENHKLMLAGRRQNEWLRHIESNGKVGACIDTPPPGPRVQIKGTASILDTSWTGDWEPHAIRYTGQEAGHAYYEKTKAIPRVLVSIEPEHVISWSGADWHSKYYEDFGKPGD